jgi:polyhydroxybutyrate depolymerase
MQPTARIRTRTRPGGPSYGRGIVALAACCVALISCSDSPRTPPPAAPATRAAAVWQTVTGPHYRLHAPPGPAAVPLVIVLGSTGTTLEQIVAVQGQDALAEQRHFAVLYVEAPNPRHVWYTGPNSSNVEPYDGVAYLRALIDTVAVTTPIDRKRVYIEGWSNGGFMAVHATTTAPEVFAAAGELESVLDMPVTTTRPVRIIHIHSPKDSIIPINGGDSPLLNADFGHPVVLPNTYLEGAQLPIGSTWVLITDVGAAPAGHGYQRWVAQRFWQFFSES